mmetsp:Transcript_93339/g.302008  ORF Transcript_93339/g.302008 Transcript_93339/m.302008 type:complete len:206 (+) Transcript_93339:822-1439(+)
MRWAATTSANSRRRSCNALTSSALASVSPCCSWHSLTNALTSSCKSTLSLRADANCCSNSQHWARSASSSDLRWSSRMANSVSSLRLQLDSPLPAGLLRCAASSAAASSSAACNSLLWRSDWAAFSDKRLFSAMRSCMSESYSLASTCTLCRRWVLIDRIGVLALILVLFVLSPPEFRAGVVDLCGVTALLQGVVDRTGEVERRL